MAMSNSFSATFSLDPAKFPYSKQTVTSKREARDALHNQLFFDLVLSEVAQIPSSTKLYPPRSLSDLRSLHEAIENCPVDLLKKQCCIYYILRDWNTQLEYAEDQMIPQNYCRLMDSYWYLDNGKHQDALLSLTSPGLTPNFATKIMKTFATSNNNAMLVTYVQTIQNPLDSEEKVELYLNALMSLDIKRAFFFTRTTEAALRHQLFLSVLAFAIKTQDGGFIVVDFPFDQEEEQWAFEALSQRPGFGLETLALRLTHLGKKIEVIKLRDKFGGGPPRVTDMLKSICHEVELKLI